MSLNDYVTLGNSGLRVSPFCLGAMTFGEDWGWGSSVAESEAIIAAFLARGGNFIDTANLYTKGHSEKIVGDFIGRDRRDRVVIATKFYGNLYPGDPNVKAIACDAFLPSTPDPASDPPLPRYALDDVDAIAEFILRTVDLR